MKSAFSAFLLCLAFLVAPFAGRAQQTLDPTPFATQMLTQAQALMQGYADMEFEKVDPFIHPEYYQEIMFREFMKAEMETIRNSAEFESMKFEFTLTSPATLRVLEGNYWAVIRCESKLTTPGEISVVDHPIIACSADKGKTWKFIPLTEKNTQTENYVTKKIGQGFEVWVPKYK